MWLNHCTNKSLTVWLFDWLIDMAGCSTRSSDLRSWSEAQTSPTWPRSGPRDLDSTRWRPQRRRLPWLHPAPSSLAWTASLDTHSRHRFFNAFCSISASTDITAGGVTHQLGCKECRPGAASAVGWTSSLRPPAAAWAGCRCPGSWRRGSVHRKHHSVFLLETNWLALVCFF